MADTMAKRSLYSLLISILLTVALTGLQAQTYLTASLSTPANAGILSEGCGGPYSLVIERGQDNQDTTLIFISDLGDAQIAIDYTFPVGAFPLEMLPTETVSLIPITVISDGLPEGLESLAWEIAFLAGIESGVVNVETSITDQYEVEILSPTDTLQWCRYAPLQLTASSTAEIHWYPTFAFDVPKGPEVTVRPFLSGWYFASVGSDSCGAVDSVYLDLAIAEIAGPDTVFTCLNSQGALLQGKIEGLATTFTWIPSDTTLSDPSSLNPVATPSITTTYILASDFGVCIASDTVVVRVDSLPEDQHIDIAPLKAYYCAGEIVALFSPSYDSLDFPDIQFAWTPDDDGTFQSALTLLNAALQLQDTTLYIRENINNACRSKDSILINVVPSSVPLSVTDTVLCPGEMFMVSVLSNQVTEPEWTPSDGLSCTKCLNPTVTVIGSPGSTLVYEFSGMILDCPVGAQLPIQIPSLQQIGITGDNVVCPGDMVPLTITNPEGLSGFNWNIVFGEASLSCSDCPNPIVTINSSGLINVLLTANSANPNFCGAQGFFQFVPGEQTNVNGPLFEACLGDTVHVYVDNPDYSNFHWDVIQGDLLLSCDNCPKPSVLVNSNGLLRFTADHDHPDTCRVVGSVTVSVYGGDDSQLSIIPDPNLGPIGQGAEVMAILAVNNPTPPTNIMWTINGVGIPSTETMITFNAEDEINFIEVTFINSLNCLQRDTLSFPTVPPSYMIPNAFTPGNGDAYNDHFCIIINGNIVIEKLLIFNRWGQLVYESTEETPCPDGGWDGNWKSERAPSDTYVYTATLKFPDGKTELAKGDVILIR